eukprot:45847-Eustigmatos_ZCMA.PRE.1
MLLVPPSPQTAHLFDVRSKPRVINSVTGTKDLQMVNISLRVLSRPVEERLPEIFSKIGIDFDERVLPGVGNEVLKACVAQYNAEELLSKREQISEQIRVNLTARANEFHLILDGEVQGSHEKVVSRTDVEISFRLCVCRCFYNTSDIQQGVHQGHRAEA